MTSDAASYAQLDRRCPEARPGLAPGRRFLVGRTGGEARLVVVTGFAAGQVMFRLSGRRSRRPSRHSLQLGKHVHLEAHPETSDDGSPGDDGSWRFMNHSCDPSAAVRGRKVVALRRLRPLDEVTFDYNTTEYELAEPFRCRCGSPRCMGWIRGFKHLPPSERERRRPLLARHLAVRGGETTPVGLREDRA